MASEVTCYKEEQIIRILKEIESGSSIAEIYRMYGVAESIVGTVNMADWKRTSCND